jgi:hypothetical protein
MSFATAIAKRTTSRWYGIQIDLPDDGTYGAFSFKAAGRQAPAGPWATAARLLDHSEVTFEMPDTLRGGFAKVSDIEFTLLNTRIAAQPYGTLLTHLFEVYAWTNAPVVLSIIVEDEDGTTAYEPIWRGNITKWWQLDDTRVRCVAVAGKILDVPYPVTRITKVDYPDAPEDSLNAIVPVVYGDHLPEPVVVGKADSWNRAAEAMGIGNHSPVVPAVCYDKGDAEANIKAAVTTALLKTFAIGATQNAYIQLDSASQLTPIVSPTFNSPDLELAQASEVSVFTRPNEVNSSNAATNPGNASDGDPATYADASVGILDLNVPTPPDLGIITSAKLYIWFHRYVTGAGDIIVYRLNRNGTFLANGQIGSSQSATDDIVTLDIPGIASAADFGAGQLHILVGPVSNYGPGEYCEVTDTCLVCTYKAPVVAVTPLAATKPRQPWGPRIAPTKWEFMGLAQFLGIDSGGQKLFVGCQGDYDVSGQITGVAGTLLEKPAHIIWDLFKVLGFLSIPILGHGSFASAASAQALRAMSFSLTESMTGRDLINKICQQAGMVAWVDGDNSPRVVSFESSASTNDYGTKIPWNDVVSCELSDAGEDGVFNVIYCEYAYSHLSGKCERTCWFDGLNQDDGEGGATNGPTSLTPYSDSATRYGRRELRETLDFIYDQATACAYRNLFGKRSVVPRPHLRCVLPLKYYDLALGHVFEPDNTTWMAAGRRYPGTMPDGSSRGYWQFGSNHHYFMVERVTFRKAGVMEIEATEGAW